MANQTSFWAFDRSVTVKDTVVFGASRSGLGSGNGRSAVPTMAALWIGRGIRMRSLESVRRVSEYSPVDAPVNRVTTCAASAVVVTAGVEVPSAVSALLVAASRLNPLAY